MRNVHTLRVAVATSLLMLTALVASGCSLGASTAKPTAASSASTAPTSADAPSAAPQGEPKPAAADVTPCSDEVRAAQLQYYAGAEEVSLDQWFPRADPSSALASACYVRSKFGVSGLLPGGDAVTAQLVSELEALGCAENLGVPYKPGDLFWTAQCSGPATAVGVHWLNPTFVANKFHSDVITGDFVEISLQ